MKKSVKVLLVFALMACQNGFAQNAEKTDVAAKPSEKLVLTVEDAVSYALENNKSLKSSAIDLEIKKRGSDFSWNTLMPSASLSGTVARTNDIKYIKNNMSTAGMFMAYASAMADPNTTGAQALAAATNPDVYGKAVDSIIEGTYGSEETALWHPVGSLKFQWNFNMAMLTKISIAKKQYEAGKVSYDQSVKEMETNIRKMFYGLLLAQENLNIQKDSLANAKARYEQAEINYKNGLVPELSVLNSQVSYENQKPTVLSTEQQIKQNKDTFAFLLGLPFGKEIELDGKIDPVYVDVDANKLVQDYCENNLQIRTLKLQIKMAEQGITAQRLAIFSPSLSVGWGLQPTVSVIDKNWFDKDNYTEGGNLSVTLVYSNLLDMLPFSSSMQAIKDSEKNAEKARLGLEQLEQNTEIQVHTLVDNLKKSRANVEAMERNVTLARKAYNSTLKAYNSGTQELLAVKDSESSLNQARLGLMNEKFNYISNLMDLETKLDIKLTK